MLTSFSKDARKHDYSSENAMVGISIGQPYHKPDIFRSVSTLVKKTGFNRRILMIADTLQAYNLLLKGTCTTFEDARKEARLLGDQFLANQEIADAIQLYDTTFRWDAFLSDPNFEQARAFINQLETTDKKFQKALNKVAGGFLGTHFQQISQIQEGELDSGAIQKCLTYCKDYIKEELAVMMLWAKDSEKYPFHFIIYPKPKHPAAQYVYNTYVENQSPQFLRDLEYSYSNSKPKEDKVSPEQEKSKSPAEIVTSLRDSPVFTKPTSPISGNTTDDEVDDSLGELNLLQTRLLAYKKAYRNAKRNFGKDSQEAQQARQDIRVMNSVLKQAAGSISNGNDSGSSDEKTSDSSDEAPINGMRRTYS